MAYIQLYIWHYPQKIQDNILFPNQNQVKGTQVINVPDFCSYFIDYKKYLDQVVDNV